MKMKYKDCQIETKMLFEKAAVEACHQGTGPSEDLDGLA